MTRFIKLVLSVGLFFLVGCMLLEFYQPSVNNKYTYKYKYMNDRAEEVRLLILGNSLMENSFNPHVLGDSVFELAISGRWIYYDVRLLERYIDRMNHLNTVILGIGYAHPFEYSYHFDAPGAPKEFNNHEKYMYEKFMGIEFDKKGKNWLGFYRGYLNFSSLVAGCTCDTLGYERVDGQAENWQDAHNIDPDLIFNPTAKQQLAEHTDYLKEMARLCDLHGVRFVVIIPPCHDSYNANVREEGLCVLYEMINSVRELYPIEFKDYLRDEAFRADSVYYNCSHLNSIGADAFALKVKNDFGL